MLIYNVLQSTRILADSARIFGAALVRDLEVDRARLDANVAGALLLATALNPLIGYDKVARITAKALADRTTPRDAALALGYVTAPDYDRFVDARAMAGLDPDCRDRRPALTASGRQRPAATALKRRR